MDIPIRHRTRNRPLAVALVVELPLAWLTSRLMSSMVFKLSTHDPLSFAAAALGTLLVSTRRRADSRPACRIGRAHAALRSE